MMKSIRERIKKRKNRQSYLPKGNIVKSQSYMERTLKENGIGRSKDKGLK